jgi:hypothetical protein
MDRQSSTSGNYRDCSKISDPHGDGSSIGPTGLTGHSLKWFQSASDLACNRGRCRKALKIVACGADKEDKAAA